MVQFIQLRSLKTILRFYARCAGPFNPHSAVPDPQSAFPITSTRSYTDSWGNHAQSVDKDGGPGAGLYIAARERFRDFQSKILFLNK